MKRITKKLCSAVCALLAFSGNRGGALTKEILRNIVQYLVSGDNYLGYYICFHKYENEEWITRKDIKTGEKAVGYLNGIAMIASAVDGAKQSYDIVKGLNNKPDAKKESTNYWPILEVIYGISFFVNAFSGYGYRYDDDSKGFCSYIDIIAGTASLADAYFRFRGNNQTNESPIQKKEEATQPNQTLSNPENSKGSSSDKK